jgi:hypothetical protein
VFHIILILIAFALGLAWWNLVHSAPRVLSMILPRSLTWAIGTGFLVVAIFSAFAAAHVLRDPEDMLGSFVTGYVGLWFILATSSGMRGSREDQELMRRLALMIGMVVGVIIASLYVHDPRLMALLNLALVASGFAVTQNYLRSTDGRR